MANIKRKPTFGANAVSAFERTYDSLFEQAHVEVERLDKVNVAMTLLENELLDPERIANMEVGQQLALADLLSRTSNNTIKNLMGFGTLFMNIKTVVGLLDGIQHTTSILPGSNEDFPGFEDHQNNGRHKRLPRK